MKTAALVIALMISQASGQQSVQVGYIFTGTCDSDTLNTQFGATEVWNQNGMGVAEFDVNNGQNLCMGEMSFDGQGDTFVMSDQGTFEFNPLGQMIGQNMIRLEINREVSGVLPVLYSILHDQSGNFYVANGTYIFRTGPSGGVEYQPSGGVRRFDLAGDQTSVVYVSLATSNATVFDINSQKSGAALTTTGDIATIRILSDSSLLALDKSGVVSRWTGSLNNPPYQKTFVYTALPAVANIALAPDGATFWAIQVWYDDQQERGNAVLYQINIADGSVITVSPDWLPYGRYYSSSLGIYGDGMNTLAKAVSAVKFASLVKGAAVTKSIAIKNAGLVEMIISAVAVQASDGDTGEWAIVKNRCWNGVKPGTHCNVWVQYVPTRVGQQTATLSFYANLGNSPRQVALIGYGR